MTKEEKKKAILFGCLIGGGIVLWWLLRKSNKYNPVINGAGQKAGTTYLTYNIPPINSEGYTAPNFGDIVIAAGNPSSNSGSCNDCDAISYYGTTAQLAAGLPGSESYSNYQLALNEALNNFEINSSYTVNPGSIYAPPVSGNV